MSTIDQPQSFPALQPKRPFEELNYQRVGDLEDLGWEIVGSASVTSSDADLLLEHAKEVTPAKLFDGPVLAVGVDGRYFCMRKKKPGFASFRGQADR